MKTTVVLSDGNPCEVKRLGLFELDGKGPELLGPFTYKVKIMGGQEVEDTYPLERITRPPQPPEIGPNEEIVEHSAKWWQLKEWQNYTAAVAHEEKRIESMVDYVHALSAYIVNHALSPSDRERVVDEVDYVTVCEAALVPQVSPEVLAETLRSHFTAHFEGREVLDAVRDVLGEGRGGYDTIRQWENDTMVKMGMTDAQWANLSLDERARKTLAPHIPKVLEALETKRDMEEMERNRNA